MNKNQEFLISVVIPTYQRPHMLKTAIESVIAQTYKNWEIIVVDDNLPDSSYRTQTENVMKKIISSNIKYITPKEKKGAPTARNIGIDEAKGEYIAFLDDDTEWMPDKLEKQLQVFETSDVDNLGLVYCNHMFIGIDGEIIRKSNYRTKNNTFNRFLVQQRGIGTSLLLVKSSICKSIHFRNIKSQQDFVFEVDILSKGYGLDYCSDVLVKFIIHDEERITTSKNKLIGIRQGFKESKKHFKNLSIYERMQLYSNHYNNASIINMMRNKRIKALELYILSILTNPLSIYRRKIAVRIFLGKHISDYIDKWLWKNAKN